MEKIYQKRLLIVCIVSAALSVLPSATKAATLYLSPSSGAYDVGKTFSVSVYVSSADQAMNAASGVVSFPQDKLQVISLSKTGSIFSLWAQEPSFSNTAGTINFEGVVMNPGFTGPGGKILSITFRVQDSGDASLSFSSGSVLANDGIGTNIMTGSGSASFNLNVSAPAAQSQSPLSVQTTSEIPEISSSTHPDQNKWYSNNNPGFTWNLPQDVTSIKTAYDKKPVSTPTIVYSPPISQKSLQNIADGIYYFHVQFHNSNGWGDISNFRFQIDTTKPDYFNLDEIPRSDPTNPNAKFSFDAKDSLSGIDHYEIKIDDGASQTWQDDGTHVYQTSPQAPGGHKIYVKAVDGAGNFLSASANFSVAPLSAPVITDCPRQLAAGETLTIKGTSLYPAVTVTIYVEGNKTEQESTKTDGRGNWSIVYDKSLSGGVYSVWAQLTDSRGAESNPTEKIGLMVISGGLLSFVKTVTGYLMAVMPLAVLILLIVLFTFYTWYLLFLWRRKLDKKTKSAEQTLKTAFSTLKGEINQRIEYLDKKQGFSKEERELRDKLQKSLDICEDAIAKEIKNINKKLK